MESNATRSFTKTLAMIMVGGKGERLMPLTEHRSKPAIAFAAKYVLDGPVVESKSRLQRVIIDRFNRLDEGTTIRFGTAADRTRFNGIKSGLVVLRQAYADSRPGLFQHATLH